MTSTVEKLKRLTYDEILLHSDEFATLSKEEQYEVLKGAHPDLKDAEIEELRLEIIGDADLI